MTVPSEAVAECEYHENHRRCHERPVWKGLLSGRVVGLCARHSRPEFHPPDLHKRFGGIDRDMKKRGETDG